MSNFWVSQAFYPTVPVLKIIRVIQSLDTACSAIWQALAFNVWKQTKKFKKIVRICIEWLDIKRTILDLKRYVRIFLSFRRCKTLRNYVEFCIPQSFAPQNFAEIRIQIRKTFQKSASKSAKLCRNLHNKYSQF